MTFSSSSRFLDFICSSSRHNWRFSTKVETEEGVNEESVVEKKIDEIGIEKEDVDGGGIEEGDIFKGLSDGGMMSSDSDGEEEGNEKGTCF